jgi:hypothetical protein
MRKKKGADVSGATFFIITDDDGKAGSLRSQTLNDLPEGILVSSILKVSALAGRTYPSRVWRLSKKVEM